MEDQNFETIEQALAEGQDRKQVGNDPETEEASKHQEENLNADEHVQKGRKYEGEELDQAEEGAQQPSVTIAQEESKQQPKAKEEVEQQGEITNLQLNQAQKSGGTENEGQKLPSSEHKDQLESKIQDQQSAQNKKTQSLGFIEIKGELVSKNEIPLDDGFLKIKGDLVSKNRIEPNFAEKQSQFLEIKGDLVSNKKLMKEDGFLQIEGDLVSKKKLEDNIDSNIIQTSTNTASLEQSVPQQIPLAKYTSADQDIMIPTVQTNQHEIKRTNQEYDAQKYQGNIDEFPTQHQNRLAQGKQTKVSASEQKQDEQFVEVQENPHKKSDNGQELVTSEQTSNQMEITPQASKENQSINRNIVEVSQSQPQNQSNIQPQTEVKQQEQEDFGDFQEETESAEKPQVSNNQTSVQPVPQILATKKVQQDYSMYSKQVQEFLSRLPDYSFMTSGLSI